MNTITKWINGVAKHEGDFVRYRGCAHSDLNLMINTAHFVQLYLLGDHAKIQLNLTYKSNSQLKN